MTDPQRRYTVEEYFAIDAAAPEGVQYEYTNGYITPRHGYADGVATAMTGASAAHERLVINIGALIRAGIRGRPCHVYGSNLRVKAPASRSFKFPDVSGLCGRPEFEATRPETLLNPSVLVEVLSPSTEAEDRGAKFAHYQLIPSLSEYVLVAQDHTRIERYLRAGDSWTLDQFTRPDDVIELPSVACTLRLSDVYEGVEFPDGPPRAMPRLVREEEAAWGAAV